MIPNAYTARWRKVANWIEDYQVEQDLILHRIVSDIFQDKFLSKKLAFRGGTALNFLFLPTAFRYSEDCDLVQITAEPIGDTIDRIREIIDPWLGEPSHKRTEGRFKLFYKFEAENNIRYKIKIEINTKEHFSVLGFSQKQLSYQNDWHSADCLVTTYALEELLGTKLRALYQRKKGRDFFDLSLCLEQFSLDTKKIIDSFKQYIEFTGTTVSRAEFEKNLYSKLSSQTFLNDINNLLPKSKSVEYLEKIEHHKQLFYNQIITKLKGNAWKGDFTKCLGTIKA